MKRKMQWAYFRIHIFTASMFVGGAAVPLWAQASDPPIAKRLETLEQAVVALERQVSQLNALLRSALPPPPIVDVSPMRLTVANAPVKGDPGARVALIEYSDFECPFCAQHARGAYRDIQNQFVKTGRVQYVFRHLPLEQLHPRARKAAEAAECARLQDRFWEFHDSLFANQAALADKDLESYAHNLQLDVPKFQACLRVGQTRAAVTESLAEAKRIGLTGTPAFLIGEIQNDGTVQVTRRITGTQPFELFHTALDEVLKRVAKE